MSNEDIKEREYKALLSIKNNEQGAKYWVSWLDEQGFCEYKLCLKCNGLLAPDTNDTLIGKAQHLSIQEAHDELATPYEGTIADMVPDAVKSGRGMTFAEISFSGGRLVGQIDELMIKPSKEVYTIDNKPRSHTGKPFYSQMRQALGYCVMWANNFPEYLNSLPVIAVIRDRDNLDWLWQQRLTLKDYNDINETLDRIQRILRNPTTAIENKGYGCPKCIYHITHQCDRDKAGK